ncbi:hypothetical protein BDN71DRAFT_1533579 [Pleurotus eryngii]|uniref:Helicase C-terminal domain-containing protein n=1 Tax=Pleurotus eryngii TaxID=5323 RepID=A0A9P6DAL8_PLEER|nr:hypothetical protein BDN71DRAFT_1533579 [Pleurotus eryngii]
MTTSCIPLKTKMGILFGWLHCPFLKAKLPPIVAILAYRGVKMHIMNGTQSHKQRNQVINDFVNGEDPEKWVLLFSSVGSVGLNLMCADIVIMLDTIWSQVGVEQITRQSTWLTQDKPVHVYYLIALQTMDGEMLETLLMKGTNLTLQKILNDEEEEEDIDLGVEEDKLKKASGSRMPKKKLTAATMKALMKRAPSMPMTDEEESTGEEPTKGKGKVMMKQAAQLPAVEDPVKRKRKAKAKSREFVELSAAEESMKEEPVKGSGKAKGKGKAKASMKRASKEPEAKVKKRTQHHAVARYAKKGTSDGGNQSQEELVPRFVKESTGSSSDEDLGKQMVTAWASQQPTEYDDPAMDIDDQSQAVPPSSKGSDNDRDLEQPAEDVNSLMVGDSPAMDVDIRLSLTPPPCGQPMRLALPTPTGMQTLTQTGATQGSFDNDPILDWMADVRGSSPMNTPFDLATGATSQLNKPVPSLTLKPIQSKKKDGMGVKKAPGSSKAA